MNFILKIETIIDLMSPGYTSCNLLMEYVSPMHLAVSDAERNHVVQKLYHCLTQVSQVVLEAGH